MEDLLLQSLLQPHAYDDFPRSVILKQTHISYIFISDNYVYKIKKPVDFGFLNFTTLDRRRFYCEEEVRLNRRLSPDVYLGVQEVRECSDGASFTGNGPVIDYAVKMRRLPEERMLYRLVDDGVIDADIILRIAAKVAGFHMKAEKSPAIDQFGSLDAIRQNWDENFRQVSLFIDKSISVKDLAIIREWVDRFISENARLFTKRVEEGFIRDCDGDLHLSNICVGEDVWIFDCIEFNSRFRYLDTLSDIAFLLMDLDYHCRSDLAEIFLDEYCRLTGDCCSMALVEFYKVYRAFIRGKVASLTMQDIGISQSERYAALGNAINYFRLARSYILRKNLPQTLIMIGGMIGSGKSTVASHLGRELGVQTLSSDRLRKELFRPQAANDGESGLGIYTQKADSETYAELLNRCIKLLEKGESVVVDATFRRKSDRDSFRIAADAAGSAVCLVMTNAPEEIILQRLSERKGKPDRYSDAGVENYATIAETCEWPDPESEQVVSVTTSGQVRESIDAILQSLGVIK